MSNNISERVPLSALMKSNQRARKEMKHIDETAKRRRTQGGISRRPTLAALELSNKAARQEMKHIKEANKRQQNRS